MVLLDFKWETDLLSDFCFGDIFYYFLVFETGDIELFYFDLLNFLFDCLLFSVFINLLLLFSFEKKNDSFENINYSISLKT